MPGKSMTIINNIIWPYTASCLLLIHWLAETPQGGCLAVCHTTCQTNGLNGRCWGTSTDGAISKGTKTFSRLDQYCPQRLAGTLQKLKLWSFTSLSTSESLSGDAGDWAWKHLYAEHWVVNVSQTLLLWQKYFTKRWPSVIFNLVCKFHWKKKKYTRSQIFWNHIELRGRGMFPLPPIIELSKSQLLPNALLLQFQLFLICIIWNISQPVLGKTWTNSWDYLRPAAKL